MKRVAFLAAVVLFWFVSVAAEMTEPKIPFKPRYAMCFRALGPVVVDGRLDETSWKKAEWTENFVDIEGSSKPKPHFKTRVKMLWDDDCFYVAADLEESDVRATLEKRDSVLYDENDFEIYIDPDGDTHAYCELEINALNTVSDIFHIKPYRDDGGPGIRSWDIRDLKTGVLVNGTLNAPKDKDQGWTAEVAIPWIVLMEGSSLKKTRPDPGDQWRMNFSRVEHRADENEGSSIKVGDRARGGASFAEDNWVWSPQGLIDIHFPEMWGFVQFTKSPAGKPREYCDELPDDEVKWALRRIYYKEWMLKKGHGLFSANLGELGLGKEKKLKIKGRTYPPTIQITDSLFEAVYKNKNGIGWHIRQDGWVWKDEVPIK